MCKTLTGTFGPRQNLTVGYISEMVHLPVTVPLEVCTPAHPTYMHLHNLQLRSLYRQKQKYRKENPAVITVIAMAQNFSECVHLLCKGSSSLD